MRNNNAATTISMRSVQHRRRLEEARRESRQKRDQDKRAERADAGKLDAHAFVWENLTGGDDSSTESSSGDDDGGGGGGGGGGGDGRSNVTRQLEQPPAAPGGAKEVGDDAATAAAAAAAAGVDRLDESGGEGEGWACSACTFWNATEGSGGGDDGGGSVRCGVCEAEGPRNARSPWLSA